MGGVLEPPLTTIATQERELGQQAATLLLQILSAPGTPSPLSRSGSPPSSSCAAPAAADPDKGGSTRGQAAPPDVIEFVRRPHHAVVGWVGAAGKPRTVATWYDWEDGEILLNMDVGRKRVRWLQVGADVSLTILDAEDWYRHLTLNGHVARVEDDPDLKDIDRLSVRYSGAPYGNRSNARVSAWVAIDSWHGWSEGRPW